MTKNNLHKLELRRNLLEQVKGKVELIEGFEDPDLKSYFAPYKQEFHGQNWFPVQRSQLIGDMLRADIILSADFHAFAQSQRTHLRLIRSLKKLNRPLVLALECFESQHQELLDEYMAGGISEADFLEKINWRERWGFPWSHYEPLVKIAKTRGYKVVGINLISETTDSGTTTEDRDRHIAKIVQKIKQAQKEALVYVVIGDLHVSSSHLPKSIEDFVPNQNILSVFQNSEKLYFDLLADGIETKVDILKSKTLQYCILTSPPWVKWQNYLMFLEASDDSEIFMTYDDFYDEEDEDDDDEYEYEFVESYDVTDQLYSIFKFIIADLGIDVSFDHAQIFTELSDFLIDELEEILPKNKVKLIMEMVHNSRSFYVPELEVLYLARLTTNHGSELIGKYIQGQMSPSKRSLLDIPQDFRGLIWQEMFSYFMSKVYNHKRKSINFKTLKSELHAINPQDQDHGILKLSLGQAAQDMLSPSNEFNVDRLNLPNLKPYSYLESARILGQFKGERLFSMYQEEVIDRSEITSWLKINVFSEDFSLAYADFIKRVFTKGDLKDRKEYIL